MGRRKLQDIRADMNGMHQEAFLVAIRDGRRIVSKVKRYHKQWETDADGRILEPTGPLTTVWHRETSAAKLILEKGELFNK